MNKMSTFTDSHKIISTFFIIIYIAKLESFSDMSWVGRFDPGLENEGIAMQYFTSLYWGMTTISTTGYGSGKTIIIIMTTSFIHNTSFFLPFKYW